MSYIYSEAATQPRLEPGTLVRIKSKSSRNDGAFGVVVGYTKGMYQDIVRIQINKKKIIHICDHNVEAVYTLGGANAL